MVVCLAWRDNDARVMDHNDNNDGDSHQVTTAWSPHHPVTPVKYAYTMKAKTFPLLCDTAEF